MTQASGNDHVGKASLWLMFGVLSGLGLDLCAKELLETYSLSEFIFVRSLFALVIFAILTPRFMGGFKAIHTRRWKWHVLRSILAMGAMFGFFYGLAHMPLVNALTLGFTAPLMMTALSAIFLGDHVGWRRWLGVSVGFIGVLIILRPGSQPIDTATVAVLIAAFCYGCQHITARHLGQTESLLSLSTYVIVGPLILSSVLMIDGNWITPDTKGWILMFGAGVCSAGAWFGFINGYRRASPAILAPLEYTALIGGAIAGFLIWDEVPDRYVVLGALIIIASGIFVVYREVAAERAANKT